MIPAEFYLKRVSTSVQGIFTVDKMEEVIEFLGSIVNRSRRMTNYRFKHFDPRKNFETMRAT